MIGAQNVGEWLDWLIRVTAVVGGIAVLLRFAKTWILDPMQTREEQHIRRVVSEELAGIRTDLAAVLAEVTYNSGTSLKDAVRRVERDVVRVQGHLGIGLEPYSDPD